jgi:hypothetical protein
MKERKHVKKLVAKHLRKCSLGRPTSRWDDNINAGCEDRI